MKFANIWIREFDHSDLVGPATAIEAIKKDGQVSSVGGGRTVSVHTSVRVNVYVHVYIPIDVRAVSVRLNLTP